MKNLMTPQEHFAAVARPQIQRSQFDRSHGYKTTFDAGKLIPIYLDEALPGDTFNMRANIFGRLATPLKPVMDNMYLDVHFFSVPNRLVWENWERFNGAQDNPTDSVDFIMPTSTSPVGGYGENSLHDYMGIPTKIANIEHRADFLRAYALIWNEWFRDENLQNSAPCPKGDGPDAVADQVILPRGKRKDYFTSAMLSPQKGQPVYIPLGTTAPILGNALVEMTSSTNAWQGYRAATGVIQPGATLGTDASAYLQGASNLMKFDPRGTLTANMEQGTAQVDLSAATSASINQLREAFQVQGMYELDARGGTRYTELLRAHFGVISPDARLQRPEYLGGFTSYININPIAQTAPTGDDTTPQGNLAGFGTVSNGGKGFIKSFTEHEIIIGLASVRADLNYQQGLNRMWSRSTRFDFYWPLLANLGEQAILNKEIYAQGNGADEGGFGYQERYAEYRYKPSQVTALFRSNATTSLDMWHLSQEFSSLPALNTNFIQENPPIDRIIAVPSEPQFMLDVHFDLKCARPMPTYAVPGLINRF